MLTAVKVLAILITIVGVAATVLGVMTLSVVDQSVETMRIMREGGYPALPGVDLETFRYVMYATSAGFILSGLMSTVSGAGIFLMKNWARILFLVTLVLDMIWTLYSVTMNVINQAGVERIMSHIFGLVVCVVLFYFFSRRKTKELFVRNSYAA